jgi:chromosome partitioning protein
MKVLTYTTSKGGIGKTTLVLQMAYICAFVYKYRVLVVDFDGQGNCSNSLIRGEKCYVLNKSISEILNGAEVEKISENRNNLFLLKSDKVSLERYAQTKANDFANNFNSFLDSVSEYIDIVIIDTKGSIPDITHKVALSVSNFAISPIDVDQYSIDGLVDTLDLIKTMNKVLNGKDIIFLGFLINKFQKKEYNKENMDQLSNAYGDKMFRNSEGGLEYIPDSIIFKKNQDGIPIWDLKDKTAKEGMKILMKIYSIILKKMGFNPTLSKG